VATLIYANSANHSDTTFFFTEEMSSTLTAIAIEQCLMLYRWHPVLHIKGAIMQTLLLEAHDQWVILFYIACSVGAMLWSMRNRG